MNKMVTKNIVLFFAIASLIFLPVISYAEQESRIQVDQESWIEKQAASDKISLDLKGMDIIDVLKILSMYGNLNIVAGKNIVGKVTVFLKNVGVLDALEIILAANELTYEKKGEIINVMTERDYELLYGEKSCDKKTVKIIKLNFANAAVVGNSLNQIKTKIGRVIVDEGSKTIVLIDVPTRIKEMEEAVKNMDLPTKTETFILNYAKAEDLEGKIRESLTKNIGELKIDERMNRVIVTDLPAKVDYIRRILTDFDKRDKVALIEAKIIQITLNKDIGYGINWNNIFAGIDTVAQSDLSINLPGVTPATTFTYTRARGDTDYGDQVILRLLETLGKTNVLSTPRITVASNQEAKVLVGTKEAYITSTISQSDATTTTADNVQFVDVGVALTVTPIISEDGFINLKIKPEVSSATESLELTNADGSVRTSVPIVTTSEAETQLLVKDGTTIILAGLMSDSRADNTEKIPVLGDVPLLGHFFKSRGKEEEKTELVIFLTPHIIKEDEDVSENAREYLREHHTIGARTKDKFTPAPVSTNLSTSLTKSQPKDFEQYCSYINDKIRYSLKKNSPLGIEGQEVQLSFMLTADGSLKGKPFVVNTVDGEIEDLAVKSVEEAAPFSSFPENYNKDEETFNLTICFEEVP